MAEDFELLDAWRRGEREAGSALFERHFPPVRRFFRNKLPPSDVEDAVQKTFLACVESRDRFRGDASFRTYLFTVARNELFRALRKRERDAVAAGLDIGVTSLHALGVSPSSAFARDEAQQRVLAALRRLSVDQQTLLELHYWENVKGPALAKIFDVAEPTIRTRLFRARARLREEVETLSGRDIDLEAIEQTARKL